MDRSGSGSGASSWAARLAALGLPFALLGGLLTACGTDTDVPVLTWYINPDPAPPADFQGSFGQAGIAERCSTDDYRIQTQTLPGDGSQQRIQLARRLAAKDPSIDLMSLDPVFTGEFSAANFLAPISEDQASDLSADALAGALEGATWDDRLVVAPLWANTQLLWYRKSFAEKAGLDMSRPVTWDQIIEAAAENNGTVGVQANKYEGYSVWINALIQGAGGAIISDNEAGVDASIDIDSPAGQAAAGVISKLAHSPAAQRDLSVSNEGTVLGPFAGDRGAFQVNWTFIYANYRGDDATFDDLGWTRYPQTEEGKESRPPLGGINIGVNANSDDVEDALTALSCITSVENQVTYALETGNMPASATAYDDAELKQAYPEDLLELFRNSIDAAGPRPVSAYWSDISSALQSTWHPPNSVTDRTPAKSADFIGEVLQGRTLL
ncbi:MAG: extracellular solute-binding protein [Nocardioidaceae bacterium]|nr:MAG: extracellular solute-binding protein [Nocardioidaceae bacterium]